MARGKESGVVELTSQVLVAARRRATAVHPICLPRVDGCLYPHALTGRQSAWQQQHCARDSLPWRSASESAQRICYCPRLFAQWLREPLPSWTRGLS